ncbi:uncharacterized protein LOC119096838 isoform X2 [Pollicipes pollicipes]|uniref:uncharacterized protein LOC119096838 isoform X2 n=1 Tax=Pollicipes pollicipes TaxID=41117 RepID=UPI001884E0CE|nr:uncharacterized protein LOC119096838 isoform X2 [Pollicipes pollicipes]
MVDEMAIRKAKVYSQPKDKFVGHVDLGAGDVEDTRLAKNALVFMAVGLKVCGATLPPTFSQTTFQETRTELAKTVLCALGDAELKVRSFLADGLQANLSMFGHLGVQNLQPKQLQLPIVSNYFLHPATNQKVYVLQDVVHMLKLLRNLLGEYKSLQLDGEEVSWGYIQHSEGIRAANKLPRRHVQYEKNKIKVKLAAQLSSNSVGKARLYLEESGHHEFTGVGATGRLILLVDQAFDYLNSSNPYVKVFKTPVAANNLMLRREFLADFSSVLFRLQTASSEPVL